MPSRDVDISILIANYNNGPESSIFGTNLIAQCLESIRMTIGEDIRWECLIWDDGSTDSGIDSIRIYTHTDSRFQLFEGEHIGRVGDIYNRLMSEACGRVCVRMDGDTVTISSNWGALVLERLRGACECGADPSDGEASQPIGMLGPVQVWDPNDPDPSQAGRVRCFRCWLWTPNGRRNPWRGKLHSECRDQAGPCDYVSGSWVAFPRRLWAEGGHWDAKYRGRGEDLDWFVRGRSLGYSCFGESRLLVVHRDTVRVKRGARDPETEHRDARHFEESWGFHHYFPEPGAVEKWGESWREQAALIPADARF